jgi:gamma-glutamylcyclotransferase
MESTVTPSGNTPVLYFAYGSNMNQTRLAQRLGRCGESVLRRSGGILDGWRLTFDKVSSRNDRVGFANIMPQPGLRVVGTLNAVKPPALDMLDMIELVPDHYRRILLPIQELESGAMVSAHAYVANPAMVRPNLRPTRDYIDHLLAAADLLPGSYLEALRAVECWI